MSTLRYAWFRSVQMKKMRVENSNGPFQSVKEAIWVVARYRDLHTEVEFFYKGRRIERFDAWCTIDSAVDSAERHANRLEVFADSEGEVRVNVKITEQSVLLERPDRYATALQCYDGQEHQRLVESLPDHKPVELIDGPIWSSKMSPDEAAQSVKKAVVLLNGGTLLLEPKDMCIQVAFAKLDRILVEAGVDCRVTESRARAIRAEG